MFPCVLSCSGAFPLAVVHGQLLPPLGHVCIHVQLLGSIPFGGLLVPAVLARPQAYLSTLGFACTRAFCVLHVPHACMVLAQAHARRVMPCISAQVSATSTHSVARLFCHKLTRAPCPAMPACAAGGLLPGAEGCVDHCGRRAGAHRIGTHTRTHTHMCARAHTRAHTHIHRRALTLVRTLHWCLAAEIHRGRAVPGHGGRQGRDCRDAQGCVGAWRGSRARARALGFMSQTVKGLRARVQAGLF